MRLQSAHELQIVLENDFADNNEIQVFQDIVGKLYKEVRKAGLKRMFNKEESELITVLNEYLNQKQTG